METSNVGGVLESSGPSLDDGHWYFSDWCIYGWVIHEKRRVSFLLTPTVLLSSGWKRLLAFSMIVKSWRAFVWSSVLTNLYIYRIKESEYCPRRWFVQNQDVTQLCARLMTEKTDEWRTSFVTGHPGSQARRSVEPQYQLERRRPYTKLTSVTGSSCSSPTCGPRCRHWHMSMVS